MVNVFVSLQQLIVSQWSQKPPSLFEKKSKLLKWFKNVGEGGEAEGLM